MRAYQVNPLPGQVVEWGKIDGESFRFMVIKSPNTAAEQVMMLFEVETLPGHKEVFRTSSSALSGSSFVAADAHVKTAYYRLREQEDQEGLFCVVQGQGYRREVFEPIPPKEPVTVTSAPVSANVVQGQGRDVQPSVVASRGEE